MKNIGQQFVFDVFITAIEGGIGYWSISSEYSCEIEGFYAIVSDCEAEEGCDGEFPKDSRIDHHAIVKGINKIIDGEIEISEYIKENIAKAVSENDAGMIDADCADCIIQAGLFNKIIFG